ncbi:unnamed protein product [Symbiodinium sp. KB8]|nr:unnamed protein product [Symbiodinium sp. KB8]
MSNWSWQDLVSVLAALTLREKDQKNQSVVCVASGNGLKFTAQSSGKDVAVLGWIFKDAFAEWASSWSCTTGSRFVCR